MSVRASSQPPTSNARGRLHSAAVVPPTRAGRIAVAAGIGSVFGVLAYLLLRARGPSIQGADFTYPWLAARYILRGDNPYTIPRDAMPFGGGFIYPWPASYVGMPFAMLSPVVGGSLMVGVTMGLAAFAVTREHWWRLLMFVSGPAFMIASSVQWGGLVMTSAFFPPLIGLVAAIKPSALAALAYQQRWVDVAKAVTIGLLLLVVSLAVAPHWPIDWIHATRASTVARQYVIPLASWVGAPMILALIRWRRPEARLLFCLAVLPQTTFLYDQLLVLLVPRTRAEMLVAVTCSLLVLVAPYFIVFDRTTTATLIRAYLPLVTVGVYWPALAMVLRRPNEA